MKAKNKRAELVTIIAAEIAAADTTRIGYFDTPRVVNDAESIVDLVEERLGGPIYEEEQ